MEDVMADHTACPGSWCWIIACAECGEMLTNPRPKDDGFVGICMSHGHNTVGIVLKRSDCLVKEDD